MLFAAAGLPSKLVVAALPSPIYAAGVRESSASCAGFAVAPALWRSYDSRRIIDAVRCDGSAGRELRTCRNCKAQFDSALNHPTACRFHTSHFGGETKRKFESVYVGGTMDTPDSGKVFQYWHCCGSEDPFDPGETKRKFESVYTGGTMDTPDSGKVFQYWHCCGSEDPFDPGCTASPHSSYDE